MKQESQARPLGVGISGVGFIGPAHLEALRRNHIRVVGLTAVTAPAAREAAARLGVEKAYPDFAALLADPEVDVVHLATPNALHYSQAKAALLAGKHVVCEKPLALNSRESGELVQLAAERKLVNAVDFNLRFYPLVHQAREMVRSQQLGDLFIAQGSYLQDWLLFPTDWNWRLEPGVGGALRAVADIGSHWLDLITFITGLRIEAVLADLRTFLPVRKKPAHSTETFTGNRSDASDHIDQPITTEDYATIVLHFVGGARGVLTVSQVSAGRKNRLQFEIDGSRSALAWDSERPNEMWQGQRDAPNQLIMKDPSLLMPAARAITAYPGGHSEGFPDTIKQLLAAVYRYIQAGDYDAPPDFPTFADGHYAMVLSEAIGRSAREGGWVDIPSPD